MVLPQQPPMPPPGMGGPPAGPPPIPPEIMAEMERRLASAPPEIQAALRSLPPEALLAFFNAPTPQEKLAILQRFIQAQPQPAGLVGPDGMPIQGPPPGAGARSFPPPGADPLPGVGAQGFPMPMPMQQPGFPPPMPMPQTTPTPMDLLMAGPPGGGQPPPQPPPPPPPPLLAPEEELETPEPREEDELPDRGEVPDYELPALTKNRYGREGPSAVLVESDAELAERRYATRQEAIHIWHDVYYQQPNLAAKPTDKRKNPYKSEVEVASTQTTLADRAIGLVSPDFERLLFKSKPPADDAISRDATQAKRNAAATIWDTLDRRWVRRVSNDGLIRPSIARVAGSNMTIEGSFPALIDMNPDDKSFPFTFEPLPVHEVFPLGHATLRIFWSTLGELRSMWPKEVNEAYPLDKGGNTYNEDTRLKVVGWSDEVWHGIWASLPVSRRGRRRRTNEEGPADGVWLKPMKRHNNGWRVYQHGLPALGSGLTPMGEESEVAGMFGVRGIYAAYVPLFKLQARMLSAVAEGAFKAVRPPYEYTLANPNEDPKPIDDAPGGKGVTLRPGEKIQPMLTAMMETKSGQALLEFISVMLGEMMPPVTQGRGQAASGADRFIAQQQAAALHIDPLIRGLEQTLSYYLSLMLEGFYRKTKGTGRWLHSFPIRQFSRPADDQGDEQEKTLAVLLPQDIARCGPEITVKYKRYNLAERMQLGAMLKQMVDAKFMSRMSAMDELDVEDYERENARMLMEAMYEDPDMVKTSIDALMEEQLDGPRPANERAQRRMVRMARGWKRRQDKEKQGGSPPGPQGTPTPPAALPPEQAGMPGLPPADMVQ